eukprot:gene7911-10739_t
MDLISLSRKELQSLAKQYGVKANLSNSLLIEELGKAVAPSEASINPLTNEDIKQEQKFVDASNQSNTITTTNSAMIPIGDINSQRNTSYLCGDKVEIISNGIWIPAQVKRINKSSIRVTTSSGELSVKMSEIRHSIQESIVVEENHIENDNSDSKQYEELQSLVEAVQPTKPTHNDELAKSDSLKDDLINVEEVAARLADDFETDLITVIPVDNELPPYLSTLDEDTSVIFAPISNDDVPGVTIKKNNAKSVFKSSRKTIASTAKQLAPGLIPKSNKAQQMRLDALTQKQNSTSVSMEKNNSSVVNNTTTPFSFITKREINSVKSQGIERSGGSNTVISTGMKVHSTGNIKRRTKSFAPPDFRKIHEKNALAMKSITEYARETDPTIDLKMDLVMYRELGYSESEIEAKIASNSVTTVLTAAQRAVAALDATKSCLLSENKKRSTSTLKQRPISDKENKAMGQQRSVSTLKQRVTINKEIQTNESNRSISAPKVHLNKTNSGKLADATNRNERRKNYMDDGNKKRQTIIDTNRSIPTSEVSIKHIQDKPTQNLKHISFESF